MDFSPCFDNPDTVAVGRDSRQKEVEQVADSDDAQEKSEAAYIDLEPELEIEVDEQQPLELEDYVHKAVARDWRVCTDDGRANCE